MMFVLKAKIAQYNFDVFQWKRPFLIDLTPLPIEPGEKSREKYIQVMSFTLLHLEFILHNLLGVLFKRQQQYSYSRHDCYINCQPEIRQYLH